MSEKQPSVAPDDEPDVDSQEGSAGHDQEHADLETRYTDAEILGKSYLVRAQVYERGKNRIQRTYEGARAAAGNLKDTPGMLKKTVLHNLAEAKHSRKEARLQDAIEGGASERLIARRRKAADAAKQKKLARLSDRTSHSNRMEKRRTDVQSGFENRRNAYLDHYRDKKTSAEARKALRKQLKSEGASIFERKAIVAEMPKEQLAQVGRVAVSAELSRRDAKKAVRVEKKLDKEVAGLKTDRQIAKERAMSHLEKAASASETVGEIEEQLSETEAKISRLGPDLKLLSPEDSSYGDIQAELEEAQETAAVQKREIGYWSKVAKKHEEQAASQESLAKELKSARKEAKRDLKDARGAVAEKADTSAVDRLVVERAAKRVLGAPEKKETARTNETESPLTLEQAQKLLAYQDIPGSNGSGLDYVKTNERASAYADELVELSDSVGGEEIAKLFGEIRQRYEDSMASLGLTSSPWGESVSWTMWDIAKQSYLAKHPEKSSAEYELGDPFDPAHREEKIAEISDRHLGWEFSESYDRDPAVLDKAPTRIRADIQEILEKGNRNDTGQLRSFELTRIGQLLKDQQEQQAA